MIRIEKALNLVRNSGLGAIAKQCHRLAYARGKYPLDWDPIMGAHDVMNEVMEWLDEAARADRGGDSWEPEKLGDLLYVVLSIVDYRGIDVEWVLCEAIRRNAERIEEEVC